MQASTEHNDLKYASLERRMIASAIDIILLAIILAPATQLLNFVFFEGKGLLFMVYDFLDSKNNTVTSEELWDFIVTNHIIAKYVIVQAILCGVMAAFFIGLWLRFGSTPGKMITRCYIIDDTTGQKPTSKQYVIRFFGYALSALVLGMGFIMVNFTKKRQGLHDLLARTSVVVRPRTSVN